METSGFINVQYKDYCLAETCRKARLYKLYPLWIWDVPGGTSLRAVIGAN